MGDAVVLAFTVLPACVAIAFVAGVWIAWRRTGASPARAARAAAMAAAGTAIWMTVAWRLAGSGALRQWDAVPPPFGLLIVAILVLGLRLAFSNVGRRLATGVPLWALVGIQGFRLPLEVAMHGLYERGIMPVQMSFSGLNFDILTGAGALVVARLVATGRAGRRLVIAWNLAGSLLLLNVVTIAILSTPRFRMFGDDRVNVFVTYPPFVWLPAVLVLGAFAGHLVVWRAVREQRR